ncbi:MAG: ABC transporter permease [Bacteroidales bacterium]|nr:ABC transporter permease [Bacteroidales bacterium]
MKLEGRIAARYLFGLRGHSVVTVISWVSLAGLLVSTAALIVVLSVYNGIGELTKGLFGTFDPELSIEPAQGKSFRTADLDYAALLADPDVAAVSQLAEETAWITYGNNQAIARLRGVDTAYTAISGIDTMLHDGVFHATADGAHLLYAGGDLWFTLAMRLHSNLPATVMIPRRGTTSMGTTLDQAFTSAPAYPAGYFFIQQDIDRQYALTDIGLVRELMQYAPDEVTSLAVSLRPGAKAARAKQRLAALAGTNFTVKDRHDQQPLYFKIFRTERLGIYLILSLIVLISTLSLSASLSLLVLNKQRDIFILRSMGLTARRVRSIFRAEGMLICTLAVLAGLALGLAVCWLQMRFGLVRLGDGNFVVDAFPVAMRGVDFAATFTLVMAISSAAVALTVQRSKKAFQ